MKYVWNSREEGGSGIQWLELQWRWYGSTGEKCRKIRYKQRFTWEMMSGIEGNGLTTSYIYYRGVHKA